MRQHARRVWVFFLAVSPHVQPLSIAISTSPPDILTIARVDGVATYSSPAVKVDLGYEPSWFMSGDKFDREMVHPDGAHISLSASANAAHPWKTHSLLSHLATFHPAQIFPSFKTCANLFSSRANRKWSTFASSS